MITLKKKVKNYKEIIEKLLSKKELSKVYEKDLYLFKKQDYPKEDNL